MAPGVRPGSIEATSSYLRSQRVVLLRLGRERRASVVPRFFLGEKYLRPEPVNPLSNGLAAEAGAGGWWGSDIPSRKQSCLPWAQGTRPPVKLPQMSIARENEELRLITVEKGEPHADRRWGEQEHGKMGLTCPLRVTASEPPGESTHQRCACSWLIAGRYFSLFKNS